MQKDLRIVFMGTPDFAVPSLAKLVDNGYNVVGVVTMPDKAIGRHHDVLQSSPVKQYAVAHNIPVLQPEKLKDEAFLDGSKAYLALCLCTDHWNAGEICGIYMNGSTQYLIFSHENTLLRDSLSNTVPVGRTDMTTSGGTVIPYVNYRAQGFRHGDGPIHIQYLDDEFPSIMAWNEKALKNAQAGEDVFIVSEHSFRSAKDKEEFEQYIHTNFEQQ